MRGAQGHHREKGNLLVRLFPLIWSWEALMHAQLQAGMRYVACVVQASSLASNVRAL